MFLNAYNSTCFQFYPHKRSLRWNMFYLYGPHHGAWRMQSHCIHGYIWVWGSPHLISWKCEFSSPFSLYTKDQGCLRCKVSSPTWKHGILKMLIFQSLFCNNVLGEPSQNHQITSFHISRPLQLGSNLLTSVQYKWLWAAPSNHGILMHFMMQITDYWLIFVFAMQDRPPTFCRISL